MFSPTAAAARSLSVTPTILEMFAVPGQSWNSAIKVINHNPEPLTVYAEPVNFIPNGERGHASFIPLEPTETDGATLGEWMQVSSEAYTIPPEGSLSIPVSIQVPPGASPGGHYAALLIGTRPPSDSGMRVATAQIISSLFFVRIDGEVEEYGQVRSFRPSSRFVQTPTNDFLIRFENTGNVHLQPQGEIVIENMWGRERGLIPINQKTQFGNVLPDSIREFEFTWSGEPSFSDIGRYTATLVLGYGYDEKRFITSHTNFWVVPLKPLFIILFILIASVWFLSWCIRSYIRRTLLQSGVTRITTRHITASTATTKNSDTVIDLRASESPSKTVSDRITTIRESLVTYRRLLIAGTGIVLLLILFVLYFAAVFTPNRNYDVVIGTGGQETTLNSEEILYERSQEQRQNKDAAAKNENYSIRIVNTTATPGKAVTAAEALETAEYQIAEVTVDTTRAREKSVVIYPPTLAHEALAISQVLGGVLLSAEAATTTSELPEIQIYMGTQ